MKKIIDYFVDHPIVVNLLTILIIVLGLWSIFSLNKETFPNVDFDYITIRTTFPGSAAEDVEKLISVPLEREVKEVDGIDELNAMSAEGFSILSLKVDTDYDIDDVLQEVRNAIADVEDLPDESDPPVVKKLSNKHRGLIVFGIYGKDEWPLREDAKRIRDILEYDSRISSVELMGYRDEEMQIIVDPKKLDQFDISLTQIADTIRDRNLNVSAGNLSNSKREKIIRTLVEKETAQEIGNIILRSNDFGGQVRLKDVATVSKVLAEPDTMERASGHQAISLSVKAKNSADVIATSAFVKKTLEEQSQKLGIKYTVYNDMSFYVKRRLGVLTDNGIQAIFLVIFCLYAFMNLRVSIITALGAPFAFFVSFMAMDALGITINLISMFGLILVLGMLVDDSIIVAEQYYQYLEEGLSAKDAAKKAAYETMAPVTATVLTTMVAFGSLFYIEGIMGKFLWPIPAVVIIALIASWLECFIILPGHLSDFASKVKAVEKSRWYRPLLKSYEVSLKWALRFPKMTVAVFVVLFVSSLIIAKGMRFELFPADDVTLAFVKIKGPVGTPFERTTEKLREVEQIIASKLQENELKGYKATTGKQSSRGGTPRSGDHYGEVFFELTMSYERERSANEIITLINEEVSKRREEFVISIDKIAGGPPTGKPINIEISSHRFEDLLAASKELRDYLKKQKEIITTEIDYEEGKRQLIVRIDGAEARRLGVNNTTIAREVRAAFEGAVATTIKRSDEDVDVIVKYDQRSRSDEKTFEKIKVLNNQGQRIPLLSFSKIEEIPGAYILRRFNRKPTFAISADIDKTLTTSMKMNKLIRSDVEEIIKKYDNMSFDLSGENKDTNESIASFKKAFVASLFLIFLMLIIQFSSMVQPFIIMTAIPFGLIGVVGAFKLFGMPIGFMALMGILGLVGVVINDSIVLVTFMNRTIKEKGHHISSVVEASLSRFRPVILTTFTTVIGLLPVAHSAKGDPFLKPMATSFAYGLLFSTTITLIFVPTCYYLYMKIADYLEERKALKA